jgi:hypothetical protein
MILNATVIGGVFGTVRAKNFMFFPEQCQTAWYDVIAVPTVWSKYAAEDHPGWAGLGVAGGQIDYSVSLVVGNAIGVGKADADSWAGYFYDLSISTTPVPFVGGDLFMGQLNKRPIWVGAALGGGLGAGGSLSVQKYTITGRPRDVNPTLCCVLKHVLSLATGSPDKMLTHVRWLAEIVGK